jgi:hypothetical protein
MKTKQRKTLEILSVVRPEADPMVREKSRGFFIDAYFERKEVIKKWVV